ncbi:MAG: hypothetical protein WA864_11500 [Acetobacteraceae bacterium]|jgi:hypothetical protein
MNRYFAMLVVLAGCAPITGAPAGPAAGAHFDGSFIGQDTLVNGVAFQCGEPTLPVRIEVRDGQFTYPFQVSPPRTAPLPVQIAADGTLGGQMQYGTGEDRPRRSSFVADWVTLRGRIIGATLDATLTTLRCERRLTAQRN